MVAGSLARRYARALLDIGREHGNVDALGADLVRFLEVGRLGNLLETLANPVYTQVERRRVLDAVLVRVTVAPVAANFLRLVLDKNRMAAFPDIVRAYGELADVHGGRVRATVTTACAERPDDVATAPRPPSRLATRSSNAATVGLPRRE